jgi:hypothetical protein
MPRSDSNARSTFSSAIFNRLRRAIVRKLVRRALHRESFPSSEA